MQTYQPLSCWWRLAALGAGVIASALVMVAALLPFALESPASGTAIVAREAAVQAARNAAASAPAGALEAVALSPLD
jgi:hypothetical protein